MSTNAGDILLMNPNLKEQVGDYYMVVQTNREASDFGLDRINKNKKK